MVAFLTGDPAAPVAGHVIDVVPATGTPRRTTSPWQWRLLRLASVAAAIGLWQVLTAGKVRLLLRFDTLPTVTEIVHALQRRLGIYEYWLDLAQSLLRILTGFGLAAVIGVATGVLLGRSRLFANTFGPLTELARPIPAIAIVPVAILLFPTDESGIVFITFLAAYFPIMVSTRHAVRALPTLWEDSVRTLGGKSVGRAEPGGIAGHPAGSVRGPVGRHGGGVDLRDLRGDDLRAPRRRLAHLAGLHRAGLPAGVRRHHHHRRPRLRDCRGRRTRGPAGDRLAAARTGGTTMTLGMSLELDRIRLSYTGEPVIDGLSLAVRPGEILVLTGPSGCGKSTVLRALAGLLLPDDGRILADGADVSTTSGDRGMVFQDNALLPWRTVRSNIELALRLRGVPRAGRRTEADRWIAELGLTGFGDYLPKSLSGGMRQRVQLARGLSGAPRAVLMDEPFGALDTQTRTAMQRLLIDTWSAHPTTVVFVTHDVDEALLLGDRIAVLGKAGQPLRALVDVPEPRVGQQRSALRAEVIAALDHSAVPARCKFQR